MKIIQELKRILNQDGFAWVAAMAATALYSAYQTNRANQKAADAAKDQMKYQTKMSNTSHQREVADLQAAGLNPILSANNGASTPTGASPQITKDTAEEAAMKAAATAQEYGRYKSDLKVQEQQVEQSKSQEKLNEESYKNMSQQRMILNEDETKKRHEAELTRMESQRQAEAEKSGVYKMEREASIASSKAQIEQAKNMSEKARLERGFLKYDTYMDKGRKAVGAVSDVANILKPVQANSYSARQSYTDERYNAQGEHIGSTTRRYGN